MLEDFALTSCVLKGQYSVHGDQDSYFQRALVAQQALRARSKKHSVDIAVEDLACEQPCAH